MSAVMIFTLDWSASFAVSSVDYIKRVERIEQFLDIAVLIVPVPPINNTFILPSC